MVRRKELKEKGIIARDLNNILARGDDKPQDLETDEKNYQSLLSQKVHQVITGNDKRGVDCASREINMGTPK